MSDRCGGAVARINAGIVAEGKEHVADRGYQRCVVGARKIRSSNSPGEERIAHEQVEPCSPGRFGLARPACLACLRVLLDRETHAAWTVSRGVMRPCRIVAEPEDIARRIELVHGRRRIHAEPEHQPVLDRLFV